MKGLLQKIADQGLLVKVINGELKLFADGKQVDQEILVEIREKKAELVEFLLKNDFDTKGTSEHISIPTVPKANSYAISDAQRRLWILSQFEESSVVYNISGTTHLKRRMDVESFKNALKATIDRHEILRTVFRENENGEVEQFVLESDAFNFQLNCFDYSAETNKWEQINAYVENDMSKPFDLASGPLLRGALLKVEEEEFVFYHNMHHIISDGWSIEVLSRDIFDFYEAYAANREPQLKQLKVQYKDYAAWQLKKLKEVTSETDKAYWLEQLSGELPGLNLVSDIKRPKSKQYQGQAVELYLSKAVTKEVVGFIQAEGGSLYMFFLAAWSVLMYRYTGQKDIIVGTPESGRDHEDLKDQIGFYLNLLVCRNKVNPEDNFKQFYKSVQESTLAAFEHKSYPFDRLVNELNLKREKGRSPIFDILLDFHNTSEKLEGVEIDEAAMSTINDLGSCSVKYDLEVHFSEIGEYVSIQLNYDESLYDKQFVKRLLYHYRNIISDVVKKPSQSIGKIDLMSSSEKTQLLNDFNNTHVDFDQEKTIIDLFVEQVMKSPDQVAIRNTEATWTFRELDELSNQLAHCLINDNKIKSGDLIGLKLDNNEWVVISILAILKSGAAYVPIDPQYPSARKQYIVDDSKMSLLITDTNYLFDNEEFDGVVFAVDVEFEKDNYPKDAINEITSADSLAYAIYTSGSTGLPKGVMISHNSLSNYLVWAKDVYAKDIETFRFGLFTSLSFDLTVTSFYLPLISGGELRMFSANSNVVDTLSAYFQEDLNAIKLTPAHITLLNNLNVSNTSIKTAIIGGDTLDIHHVEILRAINPEITIYNEYGPTEATVGCIVKEIGALDQKVLIGKPIANTHIFILNEAKEVQPLEVTGEMYIGGRGLAKGYLNREALTKERFIESPFGNNQLLYKTGDLGKWLPDGNIDFQGRVDDQVKIKGYRIELAEIETALGKHEEIYDTAVLVHTNQLNEKELVAYFCSDTEQNTHDVRAYLKHYLPEYMIPTHYVQLDQFPLNANGKLDRKALPNPLEAGIAAGTEYRTPTNEIEKTLVQIWEEVLERDRVGIKDEFFDLGGDSIKVLRIVAEIKQVMNYTLSVAQVYNFETIEKIAEYIIKNQENLTENDKRLKELELAVRESIEKLKVDVMVQLTEEQKGLIEDIYPMSDIEKGMIYANLFSAGEGVYHDQKIYQKNFLEFDIELFQKAIELMTEKHPMLRTGFNLNDFNSEVQIVYKERKPNVRFVKLVGQSVEDQEAFIKNALEKEILQGFSDISEPLWNMSVFELGESNYVFVYQFHHAISDGWSSASFITELNNVYVQLKNGENYKLIPLRSDYKDFIIQHEICKNDANTHNYWSYEFDDYQRLDLFTNDDKFEEVSQWRDQRYLQKIEDLAAGLNTTVKVVSLSAYLYMLKVLNFDEEIVTGIVTNTRPTTPDGDKILGCFLNTVPFKIIVETDLSCFDFIRIMHQKIVELKKYEQLSLPEIATICKEKSDLSNPFFDVSFNYVDFYVYNILANIESAESEYSGEERSSLSLKSFERTNVFFDFNVNATGGEAFGLVLRLTKKLKSGLSGNDVLELYLRILDSFLEDGNQPMKQISLVSELEKTKIMAFSGEYVDYPKNKTILDLFNEQVINVPNNVAVSFEEKSISYAQLDEKSTQLANYLKDNYELNDNDFISVKLDRGEWMIISILAVLKAGAAYVPIDPETPQDRIDFIEKDAGCQVCIDPVELDTFQKCRTEYSSTNLELTVKPNHLAYVIYTSGSTGKPKGVMIDHHNVVRLFKTDHSLFDFNDKDVWTLFHSYAFDFSVWEIFGALLSGGRLVIVPKIVAQDPRVFHDLLKKESVTVLNQTPSAFYNLSEVNERSKDKLIVHTVIFGGEPINPIKLVNWKATYPSCQLVNMYGITEGTVHSTFKLIDNEMINLGSNNIGKPIPTVSCFVLDQNMNCVPFGLSGELYLGGEGVAQGYLNRETLTAERFVENPFQKTQKLYRTGDLVRLFKNGDFHYVSRIDNQVKIRGHRIELGEIEHALMQLDAIGNCAVITIENGAGENELVAYLVMENEQDVINIRALLKQTLPEYMLPSHYIEVEELPLTVNGKIDKKALPSPATLGLSTGVKYVAPRNEMEEKLVEIWQEVLQKEKIGVKDDFFALGGHSLKALRLVSILTNQFDLKLDIRNLFQNTTIESLAAELERVLWLSNTEEAENGNFDTIEI
jgi:amino acid adenylation domain-containing protein